MTSQEQLLIRQAVPPNISQRLWDWNLEDGVWICRGKTNMDVWFLESSTSNSIIQVLQLMRRNCQRRLNRFLDTADQVILFTLGVIYKAKIRNASDPYFLSYCYSEKIQPEISLDNANVTLTMDHFERDYEFAAMDLVQKFFRQLSNPVLRGCYDLEITSFSINYKTLTDEMATTTTREKSTVVAQ